MAGPLATLTNWVNEFKKWLPSCPVVLYHGSKLEREEIRYVTTALLHYLVLSCLVFSSSLFTSLPASQVLSRDSNTVSVNTTISLPYLSIHAELST